MSEKKSIIKKVMAGNFSDIKTWAPLLWFVLMGATMNAFMLIIFGAEDFLQPYSSLIKIDFIKDFIIPGMSSVHEPDSIQVHVLNKVFF